MKKLATGMSFIIIEKDNNEYKANLEENIYTIKGDTYHQIIDEKIKEKIEIKYYEKDNIDEFINQIKCEGFRLIVKD